MALFIQGTALNVDPSTIIWAICIGVNVAFIGTFLVNNFNGVIVRRLLDRGIGAKNACTLGELGVKGPLFWICKILLKDGSALRNTVSCVGGKIPYVPVTKESDDSQKPIEPEMKIAFEQARFYIDESKEAKARSTYGEKLKWWLLPFFIATSIGISIGMSYLMPWILSLFNF